MSDGVDELLREHGRQWATEQPPPPPLDDALGNLSPGRSPRTTISMVAAAAAVLAVAAIPIARSITSADGPADSPGSALSPTPTVSTAVPTKSPPTRPSTSPAAVPTKSPGPGFDPVMAKLVQRARSTAAANGDPTVTGQAVRTTYGAAERVVLGGDTSSSPPPGTAVWVVQLRGAFTCYQCLGPAGATAPKGTAIGLIVNAKTLVGYDFTLSPKSHDLAELGQVVTLPL
jgi:hypothetical protein